jgi:hypothetical protein
VNEFKIKPQCPEEETGILERERGHKKLGTTRYGVTCQLLRRLRQKDGNFKANLTNILTLCLKKKKKKKKNRAGNVTQQ